VRSNQSLWSFDVTASWKPDPVFVERFARRREVFIASLTGATASLPAVKCRPINGAFSFGWTFEQGHTGHPLQEEGGIDFALNYLRHMINQGLDAAYAVSLANDGTVYLQAWESTSPDQQQPWPDDPEIVLAAVWHPMTVSRPSVEAP
jgi:hypothetical protein